MTAAGVPLLSCRNVSKQFGALAAVNDLSFDLAAGEMLGIGGPNGAGKTTLVRGDLRPQSGDRGRGAVRGPRHHPAAAGGDLPCRHRPHLPAQRQLRPPERARQRAGRRLFRPQQSPDARPAAGPRGRAIRSMRPWQLVGLARRSRRSIAGQLPVLDRKLLMLAGALATRPKLLLMDEPVGGLNPQEIDAMMEAVRRIAGTGITIILIEHVMRFLVALSPRVLIMHHGEKIYEGPPQGLVKDRQVDRRLSRRGREPAPAARFMGARRMTRAAVARGAQRRLWREPGAARRLARGCRGRADRDHRAERPWQDDAAAGDLRPGAGDGWHDPVRRPAASPASAPDEIVARGHRACAAGRSAVPGNDGAREPADGRLSARGRASRCARRLDEVFALLPKLKERRSQVASTLSGGERRMVGIGRGLMAGGKLLMLDEPSLGLAPIVIDQHLRGDRGADRDRPHHPGGRGERRAHRRPGGAWSRCSTTASSPGPAAAPS